MMTRCRYALVLAAALVGCGRPTTDATATSPKPTASEDEGPPPKPFVQKGVPADRVICGYLRDRADPSKCAAVVDIPSAKAVFERVPGDVEKIYNGKVVPSCPTDRVVGTCDYGNGLVTNYSAPKWKTETARADCASKPGRTWLD
jgi:hypothetical protein